MKLVIDKNIPYAREVFRPFGELHLLDPDDINSSTVNNAEILIIRSVTGVNASLLAGSKVRFVATVSTGCDHVDLKYLKKNNIFFTAAPGGNANSVAEYVITVLAIMAGRKSFSFPEIKLGVVGVGNIGRRVAEKANSLGIRVLKNDPPQKKLTGDPRLLPLEKLMDCDIITLH
ncbi:MAG: NAD(P)-dependent oxidoreductase, partial [bacterium]